jgi:NAD(P)-dependent dehydrogenase (short-subunit alcohol dehydrogenase family)
LARWTLVNNAASVGPLGPTPGVLLEDWAATIRLNLIAALATISAALPGMLARGFGRIINVSSGAATGSEMLGASAYSETASPSRSGSRPLLMSLLAQPRLRGGDSTSS